MMTTRKYFVCITHDPKDKEELLHLTPGPSTAHTENSIEYWIAETDKSTVYNDIKEDFKTAGKEQLFERIKIEIRDIDEKGYVK